MRGAAARNHRDKEIRDREEKRERERADAAGRRKGRAERRRGDGIFSKSFALATITKLASLQIQTIPKYPSLARFPPKAPTLLFQP